MGLQDKTIRIYDIEKDIYLNTLKGTPKGFPNALLGLNQDLLLATCDCGLIVWDWKLAVMVNSIENLHQAIIYGVINLHNSDLIASCSKDFTCKVYDFEKKETVHTLKGHKEAVLSLCFVKKNVFVSGSADQSIIVWDYLHGFILNVINVVDSSVFSIARVDLFHIAAGLADGKIKIYTFDNL